jgi:CubicO group peptidase (beta-lactamase class C family)
MFRILLIVALLVEGAVGFAAPPPVQIDPAHLESWADGYFSDALLHRRFSGATVVFVKDGAVSFAKGYGWDDYAADKPLDVANTGFHLGSIGKVFTATAIGQLLESGAIASIDDPANRYLKRFQLPDAPNRPITIRDLLTHNAGFEDWFYGIISERQTDVPQSGEFIRHFMPSVVTDAGDGIVYSSFGVAMLGAIVEDVSGEAYPDYIRNHVFKPLGMMHSEIPRGPEAPDSMGHAYAFYPDGSAALKPRVIAYPFFAPAGVAIATPNDFARFMLAQLGSLDGTDPLGESLRTRLHSELARNHPAMTGIAMVFGRLDYKDQHIVYHAGNGPGFDSFMALFPDQNAGLFIATMGGPPAPGLLEALLGSARQQPTAKPAVESWMDAQEPFVAALIDNFGARPGTRQPLGDLDRYAGTYWGERRSHTTWEALLGLAMNFPRTVTAGAEGLMINGKGPYRPIGNDTFQRDDDPAGVRRVAFTFSGREQAQDLHPFPGLDIAHRVRGLHPGVAVKILLVGLPLVLSGLLCVFYPRTRARLRRRLKWLPPLMIIALLGGLLAVLAGHPPEEDPFFGIGRSFDHPWRFATLIAVVNGLALVSIFQAWSAVRIWRVRHWGVGWGGRIARIHYSLVALGWLALLPFFYVTRLLGWHWP